ncbi:hypothetical protein ENBRE01_1731 [Enteropsectra breve]|nr:hypothetical protein ENBRE01_1731 [Enteropsectra breve]
MNSNSITRYKVQSMAFKSDSFKAILDKLFIQFESEGITNVAIIMDNVSFHGTQPIKDFIVTSGYNYIFLPPYSPFLNSIENMFSK